MAGRTGHKINLGLVKRLNVYNVAYYVLGSSAIVYFYGWAVYARILLFVLAVVWVLRQLFNVFTLFKNKTRYSLQALAVEAFVSVIVLVLVCLYLPLSVILYICVTSILVVFSTLQFGRKNNRKKK